MSTRSLFQSVSMVCAAAARAEKAFLQHQAAAGSAGIADLRNVLALLGQGQSPGQGWACGGGAYRRRRDPAVPGRRQPRSHRWPAERPCPAGVGSASKGERQWGIPEKVLLPRQAAASRSWRAKRLCPAGAGVGLEGLSVCMPCSRQRPPSATTKGVEAGTHCARALLWPCWGRVRVRPGTALMRRTSGAP